MGGEEQKGGGRERQKDREKECKANWERWSQFELDIVCMYRG
jgi:hypothetical protein